MPTKQFLSLVLGAFSFLLVLSMTGSKQIEIKNQSADIKIPRFIGHRGYGSDSYDKPDSVPENTVDSFLKAYSLGVKMVEFDVQLTNDGVPVLYHDWRIKTVKKEQIDEITLEEFVARGKSLNITFTTLENIFQVKNCIKHRYCH